MQNSEQSDMNEQVYLIRKLYAICKRNRASFLPGKAESVIQSKENFIPVEMKRNKSYVGKERICS